MQFVAPMVSGHDPPVKARSHSSTFTVLNSSSQFSATSSCGFHFVGRRGASPQPELVPCTGHQPTAGAQGYRRGVLHRCAPRGGGGAWGAADWRHPREGEPRRARASGRWRRRQGPWERGWHSPAHSRGACGRTDAPGAPRINGAPGKVPDTNGASDTLRPRGFWGTATGPMTSERSTRGTSSSDGSSASSATEPST